MTEELMVNRGGGTEAGALRDRLLSGAPVRERTIRAGGVSTAVLEGGTGEPLLLLHGPGEHALKWLGVLPALTARYRVVAPDLPGHGSTRLEGRALTTDLVLDWIDGVIGATCASPPTVVGQTVGGAMAAAHAAARSGVERLILVDALGLAPFAPTAEFGGALHAYLASPDERTFDGLMRYCMHDVERLRRRAGEAWAPFVAYTLDLVRDGERREALAALMERFGFPAVPAETLARIPVPVALIWGRQDLATDIAVAETASTRYGWPLYVIEDCGDDPVMEQPERFVETLTRLSRTAAASSRTPARIIASEHLP